MAGEMRFNLVRKMLEAKGYDLARINGSHHVFVKPGCENVVVPVHGGKVKPGYVRKIEKIE